MEVQEVSTEVHEKSVPKNSRLGLGTSTQLILLSQYGNNNEKFGLD